MRGEGKGEGKERGKGREGRRGEGICRTNVKLRPTHLNKLILRIGRLLCRADISGAGGT